jgi:hypothetical protein
MTAEEKLKLFVQVRYALKLATAFADETAHSGRMTPEQAKELLRRCTNVNAAAQAFELAMQGVEAPQRG